MNKIADAYSQVHADPHLIQSTKKRLRAIREEYLKEGPEQADYAGSETAVLRHIARTLTPDDLQKYEDETGFDTAFVPEKTGSLYQTDSDSKPDRKYSGYDSAEISSSSYTDSLLLIPHAQKEVPAAYNYRENDIAEPSSHTETSLSVPYSGTETDIAVPQTDRTVQPKKHKKVSAFMKGFSAALIAAAAALILLVGFGVNTRMNSKPVSYLSIDVNPSIELTLNRKNCVLSADAWNDDGKLVLYDLDLKGKSYEDAIETILNCDAMQPFLADDPELTFTLICNDSDRCSELEKGIAACPTAEEYCGTTTCADADIYEDAHDCGLSFGKYLLYKELCAYDSTLTPEKCNSMTIREIEDEIASWKNGTHSSVESNTGSSSAGQSSSASGKTGQSSSNASGSSSSKQSSSGTDKSSSQNSSSESSTVTPTPTPYSDCQNDSDTHESGDASCGTDSSQSCDNGTDYSQSCDDGSEYSQSCDDGTSDYSDCSGDTGCDTYSDTDDSSCYDSGSSGSCDNSSGHESESHHECHDD